jgi:hypothetical protein
LDNLIGDLARRPGGGHANKGRDAPHPLALVGRVASRALRYLLDRLFLRKLCGLAQPENIARRR